MVDVANVADDSGPDRARRRPGRPRRCEDPKKRFRDLSWLLMHRVAGMSVGEIADAQGVGKSTVRVAIREAMSYQPPRPPAVEADDDDQSGRRVRTYAEAKGCNLYAGGIA